MNKLKAMRVFVEVVERRSFSRAAHALHLGVASVSEQVAALERTLDVRLLDRTTRALAPTSEGAAYFDLCRRVLREIEDAERAIVAQAPAPDVAGRVRVETPASLLRRLLIPALPRFQARYPAIELDFLGGGPIFRPSRGLADLSLRAALPFQTTGPRGAIHLGRTRAVCAAAPAYLARVRPPVTPDDLSGHRCLGFVDPTSGRLWEWFFQRDGDTRKLDLRCWLTMSNGELLADAALEGLGVFMDLECNIRGHLARGELVELLPEWSCPQAVGYALYDRAHALSRAAAAFLGFLGEELDAAD